jgi:hypothetical protein
MCAEKQIIESEVAIAVEGKEFVHFLCNQIEVFPECRNVQFWNYCPLTFADWLEGFKKLHGFEKVKSLGVVCDAEASASNTLRSLQGALRRHELPIPARPGEFISGSPTIGVLIVPVGRQSGCLEDAVWESLTNHPDKEYVEQFQRQVDKDRNDNWRAKVRVHAMIAASRKPEHTLGQSVKSGLWDLNAESIKAMREFIKGLIPPRP